MFDNLWMFLNTLPGWVMFLIYWCMGYLIYRGLSELIGWICRLFGSAEYKAWAKSFENEIGPYPSLIFYSLLLWPLSFAILIRNILFWTAPLKFTYRIWLWLPARISWFNLTKTNDGPWVNYTFYKELPWTEQICKVPGFRLHHLVVKEADNYVAYRLKNQRLSYHDAKMEMPWLTEPDTQKLDPLDVEDLSSRFDACGRMKLSQHNTLKKAQLACVHDRAWRNATTVKKENDIIMCRR